MKAYLALLALVFFMGCTNSSPPAGGDRPSRVTAELASVEVPGTIAREDGTVRASFSFEAEEDVDDVTAKFWDLGDFLSGSCDSTLELGEVGAGQRATRTCTLRVEDVPLEDVEQKLDYLFKYRVKKYTLQLPLRIVASEEYSGDGPPVEESFSAGAVSLDPGEVEERGAAVVVLDLSGGDFATGEDCGCSIEKVTFRIPSSLSVRGLDDWYRRSCGTNFVCYEKEGLQPFSDSFELETPGVARSRTVYIGLEVEGVWKKVEGSVSTTILSPGS